MKNKLLQLAALSATLGASGAAMATDPATAAEAFTSVTTAATGFGPGMFGLAALSVGILIGVKWIKRARGAA